MRYKQLLFIVIVVTILNIPSILFAQNSTDMCIYNIESDNISLTEYDVPIDSQLYNHDYDEIDVLEEQENNTESDILFE